MEIILKKYQEEALDFFEASRGRCLLSLPCGSGKTFTSLFARKRFPKIKRTLVVCPAAVKLQWQSNFKLLFPLESCYVGSGYVNEENAFKALEHDCVIINYDILFQIVKGISWCSVLSSSIWDLLIIDESHKIKNEDSQRTQAVTTLAKKSKTVIELTGTPIMNTVDDLWAQLHILDPDTWDSFAKFQGEYCGKVPKVVKTKWGRKRIFTTGFVKNSEDLKIRISKRVFVKTDKEVFPYLEPLTETWVPIEVGVSKEYLELDKAFCTTDIRTAEGLQAASKCLQEVRKEAGILKIKATCQWIDDYFEVVAKQKLVVFAYHRDVVEALHKHYKNNSVIFYGGMSAEAKEIAKKKFIEDDSCELFIGNILSAGTGVDGLHLQCNTALFVEFDILPANNQQAAARIRRANSTFDKYFSYYLFASNTIDSRIKNLLEVKQKMTDQVMGKGASHSFDIKILQGII